MGFYVALPEHRTKPIPEFVGPIVRLGVCTPTTWSACVFVACKHTHLQFTWSIEGQQNSGQVQPESAGTAAGWHFFRFPLNNVPLQPHPQTICYEIQNGAKVVSARIPVAGSQQEWNIMAYSCYDQRRAAGEALWHDVAAKSQNPATAYHVVLGGGDQLYNDNVWALEVLDKWLKLPKEERIKAQPSKEMVDAVEDFYLQSYLGHTHYHAAAEFLRCTPQVNTWDDHDTFDGWGSYPANIQLCPVFQMVFAQSQRFYLLFQHGTTPQHAASDGYLINPGENEKEPAAFHYVGQLGPSMFVVAPDSRSQRSREHILKDESYRRLETAMQNMAPTTQHLLLLSAIPIIYPNLGILEKVLTGFDHASSGKRDLLAKTGLYDKIYNDFGAPDLLDDVTDHWSSGPHEKEKERILTLFRTFAVQRQVRVTIVSGDVHLGAFTFTRTPGKGGSMQATDPGFMPQIVTSGIGNYPPPDLACKYVARCGKKPMMVAPELQQWVGTLFSNIQTPTGSTGFNNRMNYVDLSVKPVGSKGAKGLAFKMVFLGGDQKEGKEIGDSVEALIPPLLKQGDSEASGLQMDECPTEKPKRFKCLCC